MAFGVQSGHYQSMTSWFCDQFENGDDQTGHQKPQDPIFIYLNVFVHPSDFLVIHPFLKGESSLQKLIHPSKRVNGRVNRVNEVHFSRIII